MAEYIEREALLRFVGRQPRIAPTTAREDRLIHAIIRAIEMYPAAVVRENVRGDWLPYFGEDADTGDLAEYGYECSICGRWEAYKEPFCNCGAQMGGAEDG